MSRFAPGWLTMLGLTSLLCACAQFHPSDEHAGVCNQLNSEIIFNGSTNITRDAEIQSAEEPLLQRSYDRNCVKQVPEQP